MSRNRVTITLIGGPTTLIEYGGLRFLTDPTFDPSEEVYDKGHVVLRKTDGPAISRDNLGNIDAVLLSHDQHEDNLDNEGRKLLSSIPKTLTTPAGASRLKGNSRGLSLWESVTLESPERKTIKITATPCRHGPAGIEPITGEVCGFILESETEELPVLYITGDTVYYKGIEEVSERFSPELILAFAGAARTRGPLVLTMSANDLLDTSALFPEARIIPVHTDSWEHFTQNSKDLRISFAALGLSKRLQVIKPGESFTF